MDEIAIVFVSGGVAGLLAGLVLGYIAGAALWPFAKWD
jgi:hypothetical protein